MIDTNSLQQVIALAQQKMIENTGTHIPAMVVSDNCSIKSFEHLLAAPSHFRAVLNTRLADQFIAYVNNNASPSTSIFVNDVTFNATAIFDMGRHSRPGWGNYRAILKLNKEPEFSALVRSNATKFSQTDLIDFIEDWEANIAFYCDGKSIGQQDAIRRIRKIKINAQKELTANHGDFKQVHSALESIELQSGGEKLPDSFLFTSKPYAVLPAKTIHCKLRAHTGSQPKLSYRIVGLSALEQELTTDFVNLLMEGIKNKDRITIGNIEYQ